MLTMARPGVVLAYGHHRDISVNRETATYFDTLFWARVISGSNMNGRVLVLNTSFEPINVCTERRAVVMIFKGVARVEEHNGHMLHSQKLSIHAPSVIR